MANQVTEKTILKTLKSNYKSKSFDANFERNKTKASFLEAFKNANNKNLPNYNINLKIL